MSSDPSFTPLTDKVILVPLTNSLYVPGKLSDVDNVIVDIGTGYFVKKASFIYQDSSSRLIVFVFSQSRPQAVKYYNGKVDYIKSNLDALEETIGKKRESLNYIVSALQSKLQNQAETTKS
jgi:prefoldin alpha subunit